MNNQHLVFTIFTGLLLIIGSIVSGCEETPGKNPWAYPEHPPAGIYNPNAPQAVFKYKLPHPWKSSSDRSELAELEMVAGERLATIHISWEFTPPQSAEKQRDLVYERIFCLENGVQDPFINCQKGFQKSQIELAGQTAYVLDYYGTAQGSSSPVYQIFLDFQGGLLILYGEGEWNNLEVAMISIVQTLEIDFTGGVNTEVQVSRELQGL